MSERLRITVASGKGGTGKTTLATHLAVVLAQYGMPTSYLDCDVEEPNGHLFLAPVVHETTDVSVLVPEVDESLCTLCGACATACRYSAIVALPEKVVAFPKLCHGCGGCALACPAGAVREVPRVTGSLDLGSSGALTFLQGRLNVGEAMAPPVIKAVLAAAPREGNLIIDAPPGTSCPVITTVKAADVLLLVTEPTPFGLNDLKLAVEMVRQFGLPMGVAINRAGSGDHGVYDYCRAEGIPILLELANDRRIAEAYSRGQLCLGLVPELGSRLLQMFGRLKELASARRETHPRASNSPSETPAFVEEPAAALVRLGRKRELPELVIVSGKGGTGKTSLVASFAALAEDAALADCDVDAADLHLVLAPQAKRKVPFSGGVVARIDATRCLCCGDCQEHCRFDAISAPALTGTAAFRVDESSCEGCGVCADRCPARAVTLVPTINGHWFVSETRHGPMVHAKLGIAQENSGKLVAVVRKEAKAEAELQRRSLLVCDGSPGIGCPVIASISGARQVLVVTEPTLSGLHDLRRVAELCSQLRVPAAVCINKVDLNAELAEEIEAEAARWALPVLGTVRYDDAVTQAQIRQRAVVELGEGPAATDIRALWAKVRERLYRRVDHDDRKDL